MKDIVDKVEEMIRGNQWDITRFSRNSSFTIKHKTIKNLELSLTPGWLDDPEGTDVFGYLWCKGKELHLKKEDAKSIYNILSNLDQLEREREEQTAIEEFRDVFIREINKDEMGDQEEFSWETYSENNKPEDKELCLVKFQGKGLSYIAEYVQFNSSKHNGQEVRLWSSGDRSYEVNDGDLWIPIVQNEYGVWRRL